jgi:Trypsin-like peptidase domain
MGERTRGTEAEDLRATILRFGLALAAAWFAAAPAWSEWIANDADLKAFSVHINRTPQQPWPGYGVYLGNGLILTASHVPGDVAETKPHVVIGGEDLPATLVRQGSLEGVDLTLLAVDASKLPVRLQMRRMPLCGSPPAPGEAVVVATPEGTARSHVLPPSAVPRDLRDRFGTVIGDVATTGNSGSGVFDAGKQCLMGVISRKISVEVLPGRLGAPARKVDIAKYFIPVGDIRAFIPDNVSF